MHKLKLVPLLKFFITEGVLTEMTDTQKDQVKNENN
jgi:hypothetical protein